MKKLLLILTLALLPAQAWAQGFSPKTLQSTTCATDGCSTLGVDGYGSATVQLVVTGTATAVVEGSINGVNFRTLAISASDGSGNVTSATATGMWFVNVGGLSQVRVRLSACTSCSVLSLLQATRSGGGASGGGGGGGDATAANQSTQITSLQLIDDLVLAQGRATSGAPGLLGMGAVTTAAPTYTTGQTSPLSIDTSGALRVTGAGGGTQYTQDAALTVGTSVGTLAMGRASAAVPTDVSADNDAVMPWYLRSGAQATQPTYGGVLATTGNGVAGTGVQRVTLASDGTGVVGATQSGTWNVTNVSGTVSLPTGAATAANQATEITALQLIDNIPNTLGSTTSGQSGVLGLGAVTTSAPSYTTAQSNALSLQTDGSLRVVVTNGAAGGTSGADNATFTDNSTNLTPVGGPAESASPTACTEGKLCTAATTLNRALKVTLYDTSGTALAVSQDQTEDAAAAGGETGPMVLSVRRDSAASSAGTDGDFATFNTDALGRLWVNCGTGCSGGTQYTQDAALTVATSVVTMAGGRASAAAPTDVSADNDAVMPWYLRSGAQAVQPTFGGVLATTGIGATGTGVQRVANVASGSTGSAPPAQASYIGGLQSGATGGLLGGPTVCDSDKAVNISTATTTLMVTGVSGRKVRICSFHLVAGAAQNVAWLEGTGATCGTGTAGMAGGTTAASGYNLAANGGIAIGNGWGEVLTAATTGDSVCLITSAAAQLSGSIKYAIY